MHTSGSLSLAVAAIVAIATLGGCAEDEGRISWVEHAPLEQMANETYRYAWHIERLGDEPLEVRYTNIHFCPADDASCRLEKKGGTRRESPWPLIGVADGTFEYEAVILPPGQWRVAAFSKLLRHSDCEEESHVLEMDDLVTVTGVGFDDPVQPLPGELTVGAPVLVRWRAYPSPSDVQLVACPPGGDGSDCLTVGGNTLAGSLYEASFTPSAPGAWTVEVRATIDGVVHAAAHPVTVR